MAQQAFRGAVGLDYGDADAGGGDVLIAVALAQKTRSLQQLGVRQGFEVEGKFVAAQPCGQLGCRLEFAQAFGHVLDHGIASAVAGQVVDRLEIIQVDQQEGAALQFGQGVGQPSLEALAIVESGQRIVVGQIAGTRLRALEFGQVQSHRQDQGFAVAFLADQRMYPGDIAQAVGGGEQRLESQRRGIVEEMDEESRTPVAAFLRRDHLLEVILSDQLLLGEAGQGFHVMVGHADHALAILGQDQRLRRVQQAGDEVAFVRQGVDQLGEIVLLVACGSVERFELAGERERRFLQGGEFVARCDVAELQMLAGVAPAAVAQQWQAGADPVHPPHQPGKRNQQHAFGKDENGQPCDQIGQEGLPDGALGIGYVLACDEIRGVGRARKRLQLLPHIGLAFAVGQRRFELWPLWIGNEIRLVHHRPDSRGGGGDQRGFLLAIDSDRQIVSAALAKRAQQAGEIHRYHHHAGGTALAQHRRHAVKQAAFGTVQAAGWVFVREHFPEPGGDQRVGRRRAAETGQQPLTGIVQAQAFEPLIEAELVPVRLQGEAGIQIGRAAMAGHQKIGQCRSGIHQLAFVLLDQEAQQRLVAGGAVEACLLDFAAQVCVVDPGKRHRADRHGQRERQQQLPFQAQKGGRSHVG